jgi:DNA-binding response OmpR family regulator
MRTTLTANGVEAGVDTKVCYVLADNEIWSGVFSDALTGLDLDVQACAELHELFEICRERPAGLLVLAQRNASFAVRACRVIRGLQEVPIVVVMQREEELIAVLDAGADDAVVSRADPQVLAARVRSLLRRSRPASAASGSIEVRELVIDLEKYQITLRGEVINLTPTEFRLLAVLAQQAGRVVDPRSLLSAVHQHEYSERDAQNLVKVHIANLRRKMSDQRTEHPYILCVRGFGYMLERRGNVREDDPISGLIEQD